ncbi:hypothetical protein AMTRI_Chr12g237050 [Amborella trichopoda]
MNMLNERTLKGTFFGNYKPHSDLPSVVDKYMKKVHATWRSLSHIQSHSERSIRLLNTCSKGWPSLHNSNGRVKLEEANKNRLLVGG